MKGIMLRIKAFFSDLWQRNFSIRAVIIAVLFAALVVFAGMGYFYDRQIALYKAKYEDVLANTPEAKVARFQKEVLLKEGVDLGVDFGDLGKKLIEAGVIDEEKFLQIYSFSDDREKYKAMLTGKDSRENIVMDEVNSRFILNALWALGLAQKSDALANMKNEFDDVSKLASTGGWSLGKEDAMTYYGKSELLKLSDDQQKLVSKIAGNIYRPCCGNSAAFPDCNHGMAMLGFIELMVANGKSENEIYKVALKMNSYWFPDTYMTLANYFEIKENKKWKDVDPKEVLGEKYSSGYGYANVVKAVSPVGGSGGGGGCGV